MGSMKPGHIFTIEPIISEGTTEYITWRDGWTMASRDGGASAQFENTILVTKDGLEELTGKISTSPPYFWETA